MTILFENNQKYRYIGVKVVKETEKLRAILNDKVLLKLTVYW